MDRLSVYPETVKNSLTIVQTKKCIGQSYLFYFVRYILADNESRHHIAAFKSSQFLLAKTKTLCLVEVSRSKPW